MIVSFVFEFDAYCVNGHATHAKPSVAASRSPPNLLPTSTTPRRQTRSHAIEVACAAGRSSHLPVQPNAQYPGRYASYETGPYVSPRSFADSQRPFVWIRSRTSPSASAGPHFGRSPSTGKCLYGLSPWLMRSAPITPAYPTSITFEARTFNP